MVYNSFSKAADTYDQYATIQEQSSQALIQRLNTVLKTEATTLLDIGCGTGKSTLELATQWPSCAITGIDTSEAMVNYASTTHAHPNITYVTSTLEALPKQATYDVIFSANTLHWLGKANTWVTPCEQLAMPHAHLAITLFGPATYTELNHVLDKHNLKPVIANTFETCDAILAALDPQWDILSASQDHITHIAPSFMELLRQIKFTGTNPSPTHRGLWTKHRLSQLEQTYRDLFFDIRATFHIITIIAKKKA